MDFLDFILGFFDKFDLLCIGADIAEGVKNHSKKENQRESKEHKREKIKMPMSSRSIRKMDYTDVASVLRSTGFTNIKCVPVKDVIIGVIVEEYNVKRIELNGHSHFRKGKKVLPDSSIVIYYHLKKK